MAQVARAGIPAPTKSIGRRPSGGPRAGLVALTRSIGRRSNNLPLRTGMTPSSLTFPAGLGYFGRRASSRGKRFGQTPAGGLVLITDPDWNGPFLG